MTKVCVVVVEYRAPELTIPCIEALLSQGVDNVVVVDNSDDGKSSLATLQRKYPEHSSVFLHDAGSNLGFAAAVNLGLAVARARYACTRVLIINNDAIASAGAIDGLSDALDRNVDAAISFPKLVHAGEPLEEIYYHRWFAAIGARARRGAFPVPRGCCMMLELSQLRTPLFDEAFFMYGEELELGWSLRSRSNALIYVPACTVVHRGSASAGLGSRFYEERTAAAHLILSPKLRIESWNYFLLLAVRWLSLIARAILRSMRARSLMPIAALLSAFGIARDATEADP